MVSATEPTIPDMEQELLEHQWRQKSKHLWVSPRGKVCIGVRDAWLELTGSEEFASTMSKRQPRRLYP